MVDRPATPVIVGVTDIKNRSTRLEDAVEPIELMCQAVNGALKDTTLATQSAAQLQSAIDSINVVANWTWPYPDAPGLLGSRLGVSPSHKLESDHGGNSPGKLLDGAARRVAYRKSKVAVVTGGEALASLAALKAANHFPPPKWTHLDDTTSVLERQRPIDLGIMHSIALATQVYPLYETGFRAHRQQTLRENHQESMQLYANFARVAEKHPQSWNYGKPAETEQSIGTVTKKNRMICHPYPLLMNAFNTVNLAAACIVTTTEFARELGIPETRWIYPLGGAGTSDSAHFWERQNYHSSPAIAKSLDTALQVSGLRGDEVDLFDFYSCFPIVPKLACHYLNLPITDESRPVTLLGGLTSFGGAGNNYSMHAITQMVRELRNGKGRHGLVLANGGLLTYQHVVCLSVIPRAEKSPYPNKDPLPPVLQDTPCPSIDIAAEGKAVIETYTVQYGRDNSPQEAFVIGRLKSNGHRFLANAEDERTLRQLSSETVEQIGKVGWVRNDADTGRNLFALGVAAKV